MPKVTFSSDNKVQQGNDYPRLKLEHGERALIVCIEPEPEMEYVHTLRAPEIGPDGRVIKEMKQGKKGEYEAAKLEFIGQHLCFGNFDKMVDKGADPDNCPTCKAALEGDGIDQALPRYAMHVLRYNLQPGGFAIREPFGVTTEAWVYAASRFNALVDLAQEWGDLRKHDLKLGPCENKNFQKYDINVSAKAEWLQDDARKKQAAAEYQNNRTNDLASLIGRKISKEQAQQDIARVQERVAQAYGRTEDLPAAAATASASIDSDVASLLGESTDTNPAPAGDVFGTPTPGEAAAAESIAPAADVPAAAGADLSFDDVLATL
jgi:hypothetical protein